MTVLDRYFQLSDQAGADEAAFQELIGLFAEQATLVPAGHAPLQGSEQIQAFFREFFRRNAEMHHFWTTLQTEDRLETKWAVAGRRHDGSVFALQGVDVAELDADGKIARLEVRFS